MKSSIWLADTSISEISILQVWSSEYQNAGLDDLKAVVCDIAGHQPEVCK